jgi:CBS domain containing-hemolysin-like protein
VDGATDLRYLAQILDEDALLGGGESFTSIAGFLLDRLGTLPETGQVVELNDLRFDIVEVSHRRIATVDITRVEASSAQES